MSEIKIVPLQKEDRSQFVLDNQEAFRYGALEEFGLRDNHFEEEDEIISKDTIIESINSGTAYRIVLDGRNVGGLVVNVEGDKGELELLFVSPKEHSKGIGYSAWCEIEKMYPNVRMWQTYTPYFEKRNIHFYVNKCKFHIVEFYDANHKGPHNTDEEGGPDEMFRFEKVIDEKTNN